MKGQAGFSYDIIFSGYGIRSIAEGTFASTGEYEEFYMKAFIKRYCLSNEKKKDIISLLTDNLKACLALDFAYIHGSFISEEEFGDIDIAVYLTEGSCPAKDLAIKLEIELEIRLEKLTVYPVDVRVINGSPLSFRYNVLKGGKLLFARNEDIQTDFAERTISAYIDFAPYRNRYLKEVLNLEI